MDILKIRLKEKEKTLERAQDMIDHYIPDFLSGDPDAWREYNNDLANYKLFNNELDKNEFKPYCDPLGLDEDLADISFKLKPFNIGAKNINVLLGEEIKRNDRFSATLAGESGNYQRDLELKEKYEQSVRAELEKIVMQKQVELGMMTPEEAEQYMQYLEQFVSPDDIEVGDFQSELEILANKIIGYAYHSQDVTRKKNDAFQHMLISDKEIIYVGIHNGKPVIKVENPLFCFFEKSPDVEYIQDGNWAGKISVMTVQDVITEYADELTEKEIDDLESRLFGGSIHGRPEKEMKYHREKTVTNRFLHQLGGFDYIGRDEQEDGMYGRSKKSSANNDSTLVEVVHMEWKWLRKVGFLEFFDDYGQKQQRMVGDDYPLPDDVTKIKYRNNHGRMVERFEWVDDLGGFKGIEYMWIPEVWEITRIDGDMYTRFRRVPGQHISLENPFDCKLSYHGRRFNATNVRNISAMGRQKPYIFLYIIVMYQIGELVSRNYGPILNLDTSQIDPNLGNADGKDPVQTTLSYIRSGYNWYNSMNVSQGTGALFARPQPGSVTNMSTTMDLLNIMQIAQWLDVEAGMAIGVSPQRKAQFSSNSNVTDNQQSITQSSHITEKMFFLHNQLWASIVQTYVDKFRRWAAQRLKSQDQISLNYILPDKSREVLKMTDIDLSELNIFPSHSSNDDEYLRKMEELTLVFGQNEGSMTDISNILLARSRGTSPEEVHKMIKIAEEKRAEIAQANEENAINVRERIVERQIEREEDAQAHDIEKIMVEGEEDRKTEVLKASLDTKPNQNN